MCSIVLSCPEKVAVNSKGLRKRSGEPNEVGREGLKPMMALRQRASWEDESQCFLFEMKRFLQRSLGQ